MSRDTVASVTSAASLPQLRFRLLANIVVSSETYYCATGDRFIFSAQTYSPVGPLGGISSIKEESDIFPRGVTMWLRAISSVDLAPPLAEDLFNKSVKLFRAFIAADNTLVGTPQLVFSGRINECDLTLGDPERGNFYEIAVESRLRREARSAYFNKETLWQAYSGDQFYRLVTRIPNYRSDWGQLGNLSYAAPPVSTIPHGAPSNPGNNGAGTTGRNNLPRGR